MTVAEPVPAPAPKVAEHVPTYSTVQIRDSLLDTRESNTLTVRQSEQKLPGIVLKFQLPSEPAELRRLFRFSSVRVNVTDVPFSPRRD